MATSTQSRSPEWLRPSVEEEGLARYVETLRERLWVIVLAVILTTGAAIAYVVAADKVYEANSSLLVTPVSNDDPTLSSLGLIQESADPLRAVETAAALVTTAEVAERVVRELQLDRTSRSLLRDVTAHPVAESNLVEVTAQGPSPDAAAGLATAFARQAVGNRTEQLHEDIAALIPQLEQQLEAPGQTPATTDALSATVARLQTLARLPTPEMRLETAAEPPLQPVSPRPLLSLTGGLLAGIFLGIAGAFAFQALDPTLRREEQLRRLYRLPILARIPKEPTRTDKPLGPRNVSAPTLEAYRTLRATLATQRSVDGAARSVLVTGSGPGEGKTTTAVNLAASLAAAGNRVILIDADLRRPAIHKVLGIEPEIGIVSVLIENVGLEEALLTTEVHDTDLRVLAAEHEGGWIAELFALPAARQLIERAKQLADYVIIDSAPLVEVSDALPLARTVDDLLVVVRLGRSNLGSIHRLGELLAENSIAPSGFAVVGTQKPPRSYYYHTEGQVPRSLFKPHRREDPIREKASTPMGSGAAPPGTPKS